MVDWTKKILENRKHKQQEKERNKKEEEESKTATENNRKEAISFISNVAVPAFEKAKTILESDELKMNAWYNYEPKEENTTIEMEVKARDVQNAKNQIFRYLIDMEYTLSSVTPCAEYYFGDGHRVNRYKIEKTNNNSAIPKTTGQLINITKDDIYEDLMKRFNEFDDKHKRYRSRY